MAEGWPFDQPPDAAAVTVEAVLDGGPILFVSHDAEDHGWQFLDGRAPDESRARVIAMGTALRLDGSLRQLADLPPGWIAWRDTQSGPWRRAPSTRRPGDIR